MSNIKLAIRLRPFSERELKSEKDCTPVVNVIDDNTVTITNIKVSASGAGDSRERIRRYLADYTFDSSHEATGTRRATQDKVFDTMGRDVLACVTGGKSACVLAYGQSATGKTHTMMGSPGEPGLVPRLCNALATQQTCDITVSFLEIYNERVHDLLVGEERISEYASLPRRRGNARKDLRVREHPSRGPYVQNLRRVLVHDAESLQALVAEGALRRRTAATKRNATSSRSHALLELATPYATLHLADLAGSEKASWEGCGGGRQKEGANINKSLVALSNVISALVNCGGGRGRFVPYRDSALTWLLKDCFTGGAAAFIIATVSPSVACYGESASTLRWASRARLLRTAASRRNTSSLATRSALQSQLHQLLSELAKHYIRYIPETGKIIYEESHYTFHTCKENCAEMNSKNLEVKKQFKARTSELHNSESTASSVASGSSEHIATTRKQRNISNEVDKLFGPALERTSSGNDLKIVAPLRNKRRQYKSQEVLSLDNKNTQSAARYRKVSLQDIVNNIDNTPKSDESIKESDEKQFSPRIPIAYDNNQRAEIVASVTERLYSKLKKKEESAIAKVEQVVDKKIVEPLSELKICANARQRLVDLSQKALRHRRKIGIPAHTQTRFRVIRVKDQGIDVQTDLKPYYIKERNLYIPCQDVSTETVPLTPRCKETSAGPQWGSLHYQDSSTLTEKKMIAQKTCSVMTDKCVQNDRCTQTKVVPPPRKKKSARYYKESSENSSVDFSPPIISINITQGYSTDQDSTSASDDSLENKVNKPKVVTATPDLLTNHSSGESKDVEPNFKNMYVINNPNDCTQTDNSVQQQANTEGIFSDGEENNLPRITIDATAANNNKNIKDMILGHNKNTYPYNIILSPPRLKTESLKRSVKFKDLEEHSPVTSVASQTVWDIDNKLLNVTKILHSEDVSELENNSSVSDSSPTITSDAGTISQETNNFIWKTGPIKPKEGGTNSSKSFYLNKKDVYEPVYKVNTPRYKNAKTRIYQEFLGLRSDTNRTRYTSSSSDERQKRDCRNTIHEGDEDEIDDFRKKCDFFESKGQSIFNQTRDPFYDFERKLLKSCDSLDSSIDQYDSYLKGYHQRMKQTLSPKRHSVTSTEHLRHARPTDYLQHLVQLRKDVVKREISCGEMSSGSVF